MKRGAREPAVVALVFLAAVGSAAVLEATGGGVFEPYFGALDPVVVTIVVLILGALALTVLRKRRWFELRRGDAAGFAPAAGAATLLVVPVIIVDLLGGFAADINVAWPGSLLFYPLIALIAECVFHVIPLGTISGLHAATGSRADPRRVRWGAVGLVSLMEPVLQVLWGSDLSPVWANAYVGAHVLAINLLGLYFFRRYDFVTMYLFRLVYYLLWHITWGALRLQILFGA